jgi:hypothetical protein
MNMRTLVTIAILAIGLLANPLSRAQSTSAAPQFDPYLPGELNERALYALKDNDISTAVILMERAYLLNPNSPDIKANLELVRKIAQDKTPLEVTGEVIYLDALGNTATAQKALDVPPLWPESESKSKFNLKPN